MAIKVWLDAGHGGSDSGACANGLVEKSINLVAALSCRNVLTRHGVIVGMTRTTDVYASLQERCDMANAWGANYFVSLHENAGGGDGAETIHSIVYGAGAKLAQTILQTINDITGQNLRKAFAKQGSNGDYYKVIRSTKMPAVIVEGAFLDSADYTIIDTIPEQELMGVAIAVGILRFLGIPYAPAPAPTPQPPTGAYKDYGMAVVNTPSGVNVRKTPEVNSSNKLGALGNGVSVRVKAIQGDWANIYYNDTTGWVSSQFLKITEVFKVIEPVSDVVYRVVVGSYAERANAEEMQAKLNNAGFGSFLVAFTKDNVNYLRVVAGSYKDKNNAIEQQNKLKAAGFDSFLAAI